MKRANRLLLALLAPFALTWSAAAIAANCQAGNQFYHQQLAGQPIACSQSSCHGNNPASNMNNIGSAAGNPGAIDTALDTVADMSGLRSALNITSTDLDNLAEYIFFAGIGGCPAAAPSVAASPTSAAFGNVNVGSSSSPQVITITNTGAANATGMTYPAAPTHFSRTTTCTATLAANGGSCTVTFTFSPTAGGTFTPTYTITGSAGTNVPISLSGTGASASPSLSASPSNAAFGSVSVGQTSPTQAITVTNTGGGGASGVAFSNPNPSEFLVTGNTCGASLAAGASCGFNLAYKPAASGVDNVTLTINYTGGSTSVTMSGTGAAAATASLTALPASLAFGSVSVGSTSAAQTLTIGNSGGAAANAIVMNNSNASEFLVTANNCGSTLAPGASCTMNVSYKPTGAGGDSANLSFTLTGGNPLSVALSGTGTAAATANLVVAPTNLAFGNITVGSTSATQAVTLSNTGGAQATGIGFANSNSAEFVVSGNTCGATLNAGATCTLNVAYAPAAGGADNATLTVNSSGASPVVSLSGTGTSAASPSLSASPPLASFGSVNVGQSSPPTAITISNTGGAAATGLALSNSNAAEFAVSGNTCSGTLNAGATCALSVVYTPSAVGSDSATLTFNYAGGGSLSISLSGAGVTVAPGTGQLSMPSALGMPDTALGSTSAAQAVTISNIGTAAVTVTAITSSNAAEFTVSGSTCTSVAAGAGCGFNVTFSPSAVGARSATLTVTSNGSGGPQTIMVSGNGTSGGTPPPPPAIAAVIEYYHGSFGHYFVTSIAEEIVKLDNGTFVGWARTGRQFNVYQTAGSGLRAVCRFFSTAFGAKSSHFYTPDAPECTTVKANPNWQFEAEVFFTTSPAFDGSCPANTIPVYRVYNNGQSGAPNHRYTTDLAVRALMLAAGWIAEGYGQIGVIMCAPQ